MVIYKKHLSEPWFTLIQQKKTSEGRLNKGDFATMIPGDIIEFYSDLKKKIRVNVISKHYYESFENMVRSERLKNLLPVSSIKTIKAGIGVYRQFYSVADEKKYGIVAVRIRKI
jgi:ASC-1-like (ASCH) protein